MIKLTSIRNYRGVSYLIDSCSTLDGYLETMVFEINGHHDDFDGNDLPEGLDVDWSDLFCRTYETVDEMKAFHKVVVSRFPIFCMYNL